jgi:hydroxymethylbilane synthase
MARHEPGANLRIGTRGSELALWQARWVAQRLADARPGLGVELVEIKTRGDRDRNSPLAAIGGQGLFTKEIQRAVLEGTVDVAVHSLKDLPSAGPPGLALAAVPAREQAADALIAPRHGPLDALPAGASVGTGSLRRRAQLLWLRPDLRIKSIRGNVETRLTMALDGRLDAVLLAEAGLIRLGLDRHITDRLAAPRFLPAVGQGALGIECRADDVETRGRLDPLDDPASRASVLAERTVMAELEAGCMIPLACWGRVEDGALRLDAAVYDPDGRHRLHATRTGDAAAPEILGRAVADALRSQGAAELLRRARPAPPAS